MRKGSGDLGKKGNPLSRQESKWGYLFISPVVIGIAIFAIIPMIATLVLSFSEWNLVATPHFVGFQNFIELFSMPLFWKVVKNTLYFTLVNVPIKLAIALFFAVLLNQKIRGVIGYRAIYFMPVVTSTVAVAIVWAWLYNYDFGTINLLLFKLGIKGPDWIGSTKWSMPSVIIMSIWQSLGYAIVIYLAALQSIPPQLSESASIDGASAWKTFWKIKLPMLSSTTFFLVITNIISSMQVFNEMFILTKTGPLDSTNVLATFIYDYAFRYKNVGLASATSYVLFAMIAIITLIQFKHSKWVYYE